MYTIVQVSTLLNPSENVLDLGITMSRNCSFDVHINILCKKCTDLSGWILRTFTSRDSTTLMTLFNALILSRLDYCSQLRLYSLQRRRERYCIIYVWKIIEDLVPNFSKSIVCTHSERRGRYCVVSHVNIGRSGTLAYYSFRWPTIRLFNSLPTFIRCTTSCSVYGFKHTLDSYLMTIVDHPCVPGFNNSLDGGDGIKWRTLCDDLAAN